MRPCHEPRRKDWRDAIPAGKFLRSPSELVRAVVPQLHLRKPDSINRTVALMLAATALYIPANMLPMMTDGRAG